jgi:hypothetical protein
VVSKVDHSAEVEGAVLRVHLAGGLPDLGASIATVEQQLVIVIMV